MIVLIWVVSTVVIVGSLFSIVRSELRIRRAEERERAALARVDAARRRELERLSRDLADREDLSIEEARGRIERGARSPDAAMETDLILSRIADQSTFAPAELWELKTPEFEIVWKPNGPALNEALVGEQRLERLEVDEASMLEPWRREV